MMFVVKIFHVRFLCDKLFVGKELEDFENTD